MPGPNVSIIHSIIFTAMYRNTFFFFIYFSLRPFSLALVDDNTLTIGSLDQLQMLHIHTVPLAESPRFASLRV